MLKIRLGKRSKLGMISHVTRRTEKIKKSAKDKAQDKCWLPLAWDNRKNEWYCPM